jgi:hypothetical protein
MKSRMTLLAMAAGALAAMSVGTAWGQSGSTNAAAPPPPPPEANVFFQRIGPGPMGGGDMRFLAFEGATNGKTVTGAPFSATISTQSVQTLADGNRIVRSSSGTLARDSQGRTRREMTLPAIGPWAANGQTPPHAVDINDPVAGAQYILEADRKIAHQIKDRPRGGRHQGLPPGAVQIQNGQDKEVTTTSLGTQTINGISAEGTRYTRTIPAGQIGNDKSIEIVTESWYSPDLQMVVMTKRSDPMQGDSTYQLTNIQRAEPDAALFQVPPDYTVKQGGPRGAVVVRTWGARQAGPDAGNMPGPPPPPPPPQN